DPFRSRRRLCRRAGRSVPASEGWRPHHAASATRQGALVRRRQRAGSAVSGPADTEALMPLADVASGAKPVHVICLGLSALDQVWRVDRLFAGESEKIKAAGYGTLGGGMAANASVAVARLGASVAFWGRAGNDAAGHEMKSAFVAEGVDVESFRLFPDGRSSV